MSHSRWRLLERAQHVLVGKPTALLPVQHLPPRGEPRQTVVFGLKLLDQGPLLALRQKRQLLADAPDLGAGLKD